MKQTRKTAMRITTIGTIAESCSFCLIFFSFLFFCWPFVLSKFWFVSWFFLILCFPLFFVVFLYFLLFILEKMLLLLFRANTAVDWLAPVSREMSMELSSNLFVERQTIPQRSLATTACCLQASLIALRISHALPLLPALVTVADFEHFAIVS